MTKPNDVIGNSDPSHCSTAIPRLTDEQRLELAACYAEYCGVDPTDQSEWRTEMVGAKKFLRELMAIWRKRESKCTQR